MKVRVFVTDILLLDIIDFSKLTSEKQHATATVMTQKLRDIILALTSLKLLKQNELILDFIPTGDGFYVLLQPWYSGYGIFLATSLRSALLLASKQTKGLFSGVRTAVHIGEMIPFKDITNRDNFVGDGLNDCARLLAKKNEQKPSSIKPEDQNYIVVSKNAYHQFENTYSSSDKMQEFLDIIGFNKSDLFEFKDKHGKKHEAYYIECNRNVVINPPAPPDIEERKKRILERFNDNASG